MDTNERREAADYQYALGLTYISDHNVHPQQSLQLQSAITCFQHALELYSIDDTPFQWARTQQVLGQSYRDLRCAVEDRGERIRLLCQSLAALQASLEIYTRDEYPIEWAKTQCELATTYTQFPVESHESSFSRAILCWQAALKMYTGRAFPYEQTLSTLQTALEIYTREDYPEEWAAVHNLLGLIYMDLAARDVSGGTSLSSAIDCFKMALCVYTPTQHPYKWAEILYNLGNAYCQLKTGDEQEHIQQSIRYYEGALQIYSRQTTPLSWANAHYHLGNAYQALHLDERKKNLHKAIACYRAALLVYSKDGLDREWAATQYQLGSGYRDIALNELKDRRAYLQSSLECYEEAACVFSRLHLEHRAQKVHNDIAQVRLLLQAPIRFA